MFPPRNLLNSQTYFFPLSAQKTHPDCPSKYHFSHISSEVWSYIFWASVWGVKKNTPRRFSRVEPCLKNHPPKNCPLFVFSSGAVIMKIKAKPRKDSQTEIFPSDEQQSCADVERMCKRSPSMLDFPECWNEARRAALCVGCCSTGAPPSLVWGFMS